jgi:hypothetical protein
MGLYRVEDGSGLTATLLALQRQTIVHFADTTERSVQVRTPPLGMLTFVVATKKFEWWNGTAWVALV